jgi:hypothetical protein
MTCSISLHWRRDPYVISDSAKVTRAGRRTIARIEVTHIDPAALFAFPALSSGPREDGKAMGIGRYGLMVRRRGEHEYVASGALDTLPLTTGSELTVAIGPEMVRVRIERTESAVDQPVMYASEL